MEIPFIVTPRKDTGLFNSKIGIWLFLASEVMLFGGFFSAYVFLRLTADYPWPERTLPVLPGLINTFVLIGSSVTVVFAWAALKLRNWGQFRLCMGLTIVAAAVFMVLKGIEYNVKFHHHAVRLDDYAVIEGHLDKEAGAGGREHEASRVRFESRGIVFNTVRFHESWVGEILAQAAAAGSKITLAEDLKVVKKPGAAPEVMWPAGTGLSLDLLEKVRAWQVEARTHNAEVRTAELRKAWSKARAENPGRRGWELAPQVNADPDAVAKAALTEVPSLSFKVEPALALDWEPGTIEEAAEQAVLKDDTKLSGKLLDSPVRFHAVDAIDFRYTALKAQEKGLDPVKVIEGSWLLKNEEVREAWEWHQAQVARKAEQLKNDYGTLADGTPKRVPTVTERYRIGWKDFVAKAQGKPAGEADTLLVEEFTGPNYHQREQIHAFPHLELPREKVAFESKFTPAWNTYYAIYFTMTGLHGLHVIGGALVLGYYLFFGRRMYEQNPEWLANRVEVGGLFWHFVDLVWIFLFPVMYLM